MRSLRAEYPLPCQREGVCGPCGTESDVDWFDACVQGRTDERRLRMNRIDLSGGVDAPAGTDGSDDQRCERRGPSAHMTVALSQGSP